MSVGFADLLEVTLQYNRHHFERVHVVTVEGSLDAEVACKEGAYPFFSRSFYADGAAFNKWKALEEALDRVGRGGWICLMDADVLWPKAVTWNLEPGFLYSPLRHMAPWPGAVPAEATWRNFSIHRNVNEWAGYSQIFHASDPALGSPPWHEVDWKHAGGADSFFQRKWAPERKLRTPWNCLHLGEAGINWCGRADATVDSEVAAARREQVRSFIRGRRGRAEFSHEKLRPPSAGL